MRSITLIGASVGKAWQFEGFPSRTGLAKVKAGYRGLFRFDKTPVLRELLQSRGSSPDAIILKECAAYFPIDQGNGRRLMSKWVEMCAKAGVVAVPATVAPITRPVHRPGVLRALARTIRGRPDAVERLAGILEFNDWIRMYAQERRLGILDLERCLRVNDDDRSLRADLHSGDGLHLNRNAYSILDRELNRVVRAMFPDVVPMRSL